MQRTIISKVEKFGDMVEYIANVVVEGREYVVKVQEDREHRLYLGHANIGLSETAANAIKAALEADGITVEVDRDMYGQVFVRETKALSWASYEKLQKRMAAIRNHKI